jgi:predicted nucleotidyltransferase/HEPN domain-containing protein
VNDPRSDGRLKAIAARLEKAAQPEEIVLFGSRARGEGREGADEVSRTDPNRRGPSDADFLVVLPPGTNKAAVDALLLSVPNLNAGIPLEMELHPRTGEELCEELRRGLPKISTCAMKDGVLFHPANRMRSAYKDFADAWRLANHIRLWFYPATADLENAKSLLASGLIEPAANSTRTAIQGALHGLLIATGGDIPATDDPVDMVNEIATLDPAIAAPLAKRFSKLALMTMPGSGGDSSKQQELRASVSLAEAVVRYVGWVAKAKIEPAIPCPADVHPLRDVPRLDFHSY